MDVHSRAGLNKLCWRVGMSRPTDPNLTENSWTEEEGEEGLHVSPQRMPCILTTAQPVVQTASGAGPSTIKEDDKPVASRTRGRKRAADAKKEE